MVSNLNRVVSPGYRCRPPSQHDLSCPSMAYDYALEVVKGRWPEGEAIISTDGYFSCQYAREVLGERFRLGEPSIISHKFIIAYTRDVVRGRWIEVEQHMAKQPTVAIDQYFKMFPDAKKDWAAYGWLDWLDT